MKVKGGTTYASVTFYRKQKKEEIFPRIYLLTRVVMRWSQSVSLIYIRQKRSEIINLYRISFNEGLNTDTESILTTEEKDREDFKKNPLAERQG